MGKNYLNLIVNNFFIYRKNKKIFEKYKVNRDNYIDVGTLTKVGAIARKLGITWGGDWVRQIDRPHFEVKRNWQMPRGYKLEGQVIVPSNSKLKVQLLVKDKKEEIKMTNTTWDPGSPAMRTETENFIAQAVKEGIINPSHLKDLQSGVMTTDRLIGLYITIQQRRSK